MFEVVFWFVLWYLGIVVALVMALKLFLSIFYMPPEMRRDLRNPAICVEAKRDMRSELRWHKVLSGWPRLCALLGGITVSTISYLMIEIITA